ncbi:MAG: hypothetical protein ACJA0B_001313 [Alcanivorax borkumensis]|jgi:hypothetical protein
MLKSALGIAYDDELLELKAICGKPVISAFSSASWDDPLRLKTQPTISVLCRKRP